MAEKTGGGDRLQAYDPETGKYIALGDNSTIKRENKSVVFNGKTFAYDEFARFAKELDIYLGDNNFKYWANGDFDKEDRIAYEDYLTEIWNNAEAANQNENIPSNELFAKRAKENIDKLVTKEFIDNLLEKEIEYKSSFKKSLGLRKVIRFDDEGWSSTSFLTALLLEAKFGSKLETISREDFTKVERERSFDPDMREVAEGNMEIFDYIKNKEFVSTYRGESRAKFQNSGYYSGKNRDNVKGMPSLAGGGYYGSALYTSLSSRYASNYDYYGKNLFVLDLRGANILVFTKQATEYGQNRNMGICPEIETFRKEEKIPLSQQFETKLIEYNLPIKKINELKEDFIANIEKDPSFCGLLMGVDFIVGDSNQIDVINFKRAKVVEE